MAQEENTTEDMSIHPQLDLIPDIAEATRKSNLTLVGKIFSEKPVFKRMESTDVHTGFRLLIFHLLDSNPRASSRRCGMGLKFLRIQVEIEVTKPLPTGFFQNFEGRKTWVQFCYEKLGDFCYQCGIIGHLKKSCNRVENPATEKNKNGDEFGAWLRAEEGALSVIRVGSKLHRFETPRKDLCDSHSNEELRIEEEELATAAGTKPISDFNQNTQNTRSLAETPITGTGASPHASCDQTDEGFCDRQREIMARSPNPRDPLEPVPEKADKTFNHHQKERFSNSKTTFSEFPNETDEPSGVVPRANAEKTIPPPRDEQKKTDNNPSCFRIGNFTNLVERNKKLIGVGQKRKFRPLGPVIREAHQQYSKGSFTQDPQGNLNDPKPPEYVFQAQKYNSKEPGVQMKMIESQGEPRPSGVLCHEEINLAEQVVHNSPSPKIRLKKRARGLNQVNPCTLFTEETVEGNLSVESIESKAEEAGLIMPPPQP